MSQLGNLRNAIYTLNANLRIPPAAQTAWDARTKSTYIRSVLIILSFGLGQTYTTCTYDRYYVASLQAISVTERMRHSKDICSKASIGSCLSNQSILIHNFIRSSVWDVLLHKLRYRAIRSQVNCDIGNNWRHRLEFSFETCPDWQAATEILSVNKNARLLNFLSVKLLANWLPSCTAQCGSWPNPRHSIPTEFNDECDADLTFPRTDILPFCSAST